MGAALSANFALGFDATLELFQAIFEYALLREHVAASVEAISSWSAHNSSVDIDLKLFRFTTVPNHDWFSCHRW
jgi:hypothetical protein